MLLIIYINLIISDLKRSNKKIRPRYMVGFFLLLLYSKSLHQVIVLLLVIRLISSHHLRMEDGDEVSQKDVRLNL